MDELLTSTLVGLASRLGKFEKNLLMGISKAGDDAYCAELSRRLTDSLGREVSLGQVSRSLGALKRLGLLTSEQRWPSTPAKHQRHRLVFSLTRAGTTALHALASERQVGAEDHHRWVPAL